MKKKRLITLTLLLSAIYINISAQGYEIKIKISNLKNQEVILGHHFGNQLIPDDTAKVNIKGEGIFKNSESLPGGMYFLFLPNKSYFDLIVDKDQTFTIINDTVPKDYIKNFKAEGSAENDIFSKYQIFLSNQRNKATELTNKRTEFKDDKEKIKKIDADLNEINRNVTNEVEKIIQENPDFFFSKFLKATQEIQIPDSIKEQKDRYYYYRNQYFKYFDFADSRLLRSPIYENKLDYYLDKIIPQVPDSIIPEVDKLINKSRHDKELFRYMMVHLFNKYASAQIMGMENVYVYLAENYYTEEAEWSDREFISELKEKIRRRKPGLIGNTAPEINMIMLPKSETGISVIKDKLQTVKEKGINLQENKQYLDQKAKEYKKTYPNLNDSAIQSQVIINELAQIIQDDFIPEFEGYISLDQIKSKFIIMWFWEHDCSHCKTLTPQLAKAYDTEKLEEKGVTVYSVYLNRNINEWDKYTKHIEKWMDFVLGHDMLKLINVWEPIGYSHFRDKYDISSSPVLYLLDENKKIIAKRIGYDQAISIINEILENEKKEKSK
ncbi:MAG: DUF5106 domain-containing protein [Bacteroidales bacterium]|nr:DUF5106 domain-containing protein [Bacteroidales bacterium]MBN2756041.1 DUF5106 domain-containing protein [Bacteroidales bacterium]